MEMNPQLFAVFLVYLKVAIVTGNVDVSNKVRHIMAYDAYWEI